MSERYTDILMAALLVLALASVWVGACIIAGKAGQWSAEVAE